MIQLYMIVGLGIKLKSMSMMSWRWTSLCLPWNPRIAAKVLPKRANLSFVLPCVCYDRCIWLPAFSAVFSASLLLTHPVCIWGCDLQSLSLHKHSGWVCLSPSILIMQMASVNSCLFSAYPIALIGKAGSQEDAPFSITFLWVVVTQGSVPEKVHHKRFWIFFLSYSVFRVFGKLLIWGVVVEINFWV